MTTVNAYAVFEQGGALKPFQYELGALGDDQVDIKVTSCGICHSDLSMLDNDWGMTNYPLVPGHEVVGTVSAVGAAVKHIKVGQTVGLGWFSGSCMHCGTCMSGYHNMCNQAEATIIGRHGGFADVVRCKEEWAVALPDGVDIAAAGPLFCGGITVFNPLVEFDVKPTDRVAVIGIGGLGHLALQFLNKWGCEVTAFSSSSSKEAQLKALGAHHVVNSRDPEALAPLAGKFDFILNTTNVNLEWGAYLDTLAANGRFHTVGAVPDPIPAPAFSLIMRQRSVSGSPLGSPATLQKMLEFCARHDIKAMVERFPMAKVNEAMEHLKAGKARYRIVLDA